MAFESALPTTQNTNRITGSRRWYALATVLVTMFFASLDQTVIATAMPTIIGELQGFELYGWVISAYLICSAVMVPIYGKLSDVYGRRPFYIMGLALFMAGSALAGLSQTMMQLILFRGLQGLGAGAMLSMPRATVGDVFSPRQRGRWMAFVSMAYALAGIVGPLVGGWITDNWGWPWVFYINLPVGALALAGTLYALPRVRTDRRVTVDWAGSALLVLGLVPLLLAFTWAGSDYPWGSPVILGLLAASACVLGLFAWVERRAKEPIFPLGFLRKRVFALASLIAMLLSVWMFGGLLFLPLFVQGVMGLSATGSGAILTPMMLSVILSGLAAGVLMTRTGRYKAMALVASTIMCLGLALFTVLGVDATWTAVVRNMVLAGVGLGVMFPTLNIAVQNAFPYRVMGVVNASQQFVRNLGAMIAAPILGTVLANTFAREMAARLPDSVIQALATLPEAQQAAFLDPQSLTSAATQAAVRAEFEVFGMQAQALYDPFIATVRASLAEGTERLFLIALLFGLAALAMTVLLPEIALKQDEFYESEGPPSP